jgi:mannose-1-phosphate guanylyltransferase
MEIEAESPDRWAIILAGGEGSRLRALTRRIAGDERPKQFCSFVDGETLLDRTPARVGRIVGPDRTCLVLTRTQEPFYAPLIAEGLRGPLVVQPCGRGTAPAILYALLRIAEVAPLATVALFPSDHFVSDEAGFVAHVEAGFAAVEARPDLIVLLGMEAAGPEVQYGWIEAGDWVLDRPAYPVYRVRRFWEKPTRALAETLFQRGCLWNTFVLVAGVPALLALIRAAAPDLYGTFMTAWLGRSTLGEREAMRSLYARLPSTNFSEEVLGTKAASLAVLPVRGLTWSDWGEPARVFETLERLGIRPRWADPELPPVAVAVGSGR